MLRPLFLSHGAPSLPFEDVPARRFLEGLGAALPRPRAILVASAHWETRIPMVNAVSLNPTIHDFSGFPPELYDLNYPAPGDPELAEAIADLLGDAGLPAQVNRTRGLDHGAWVPLMLTWPDADIPVLQISIQSALGPGHHFDLGRALAPLCDQGVQIVASGSLTHDLTNWSAQAGMAEPEWVTRFADWIETALLEGRTCDLLSYRRMAPFAERNHPTDEHLLPLFVALGAAGRAGRAEKLHTSTTYGVLRMDAYAFDNSHPQPNQEEGRK